MSGAVLAAALLAGAALILAIPAPRLEGPARGRDRRGPDRGSAVSSSRSGRSGVGSSAPVVRGVGVLAGLTVWLFLGGGVGLVLGVLTAGLLPPLISRMESASARRERLELTRTAPLVADLLAAALTAGVPLEDATPVVARAVGGAAGRMLDDVHHREQLGEPAAAAWAGLGSVVGLGGIARAVGRSSRTGAPLAGVLACTADDLRAEACAAALAEVRSTAVRAVLPLGLCLLPAFVLLGIAPIVGGLLPEL